MSTNTSVPRDVNDFRAASGLPRRPVALAAPVPRGPGLFAVARDDGETVLTNIRRLAGSGRAPGSRVIAFATWLLVFLGAGLMYVSFQAQDTYIYAVKHVNAASAIEAAMIDAGMIILSALGIGLALAGKPSKAERFLIMVCAGLSAFMNYAAADTASWRSVVAYVAAPVFLAVIVDRVISVIRRHVLPVDAESAWMPLGRALRALAGVAGVVALYLLRLVLAPRSTAKGLRRLVLDAAPVPGSSAPARQDEEDQGDKPEGPPPAASKKAKLTYWYQRDEAYGDRRRAAEAARRLAPKVDLSEGTARAYIGAILDARGHADGAS
jgi:hypothetical protein